MMQNMVRRASTAAIILALALPAGAFDLGLGLGTWSFAGGGYEADGIDPGLYARAGIIIGLGPRLEAGIYAVGEAAPSPFLSRLLGAELSIPILGPRDRAYLNTFASIGFLQSLASGDGTRAGESYATLRLSPLAIGNPFYGRRDSLFSLGLLYGLRGGRLSLVLIILTSEIFPAATAISGEKH